MMKNYILILIASLAFTSVVCAEKLKSSQVEEIATQYVQAIKNKDFSAWSKLMLNTRGLNEDSFKERIGLTAFNTVVIEDIDKTKTGFNIRLTFEPQVVIISHENRTSLISQSTFSVQMLPNGKIKYDILIPHPIPFAMITCASSIYQLEKRNETESGSHLKDYGIPLFGYEHNAPVKEQEKSVRKMLKWLLNDGEDWDRDDPKIPCPEELYEIGKKSLRYHT